MRLLGALSSSLLLASSGIASAASQWSFSEAKLTVSTKGAGVGSGVKEALSPSSPLSRPVTFGAKDTLKLIVTTTDGKKAKRPHQAFLTLKERKSGLSESFAISVKENGKGAVEISHKDLPYQLLTTTKPLEASLTIASFGSSTPYKSTILTISIATDPSAPITAPTAPIRYKAQPEIHHIFRADPQSPNKLITLVFTGAVLATVPVLLGAWLSLGANIEHVGRALGKAPVWHALFVGSIFAFEGILFLYYTSWNLFQMLPVAGAVGAVMFVSGSKALTEVQERRLAGLR